MATTMPTPRQNPARIVLMIAWRGFPRTDETQLAPELVRARSPGRCRTAQSATGALTGGRHEFCQTRSILGEVEGALAPPPNLSQGVRKRG